MKAMEIESMLEDERLAEIEDEEIETEAKIEDESLKAETMDAKRYRHLRNKDISTFKKGRSKDVRGLFVGEIIGTKDFVLTEQELDDAVDNEMKLMEKA
jgi:hypothetical protein